MRVIAGAARRLPLVTPDGLDTRPTQDRIKETLFNILQMEVPGAVFLDLCAGSGGIGIEALSRGAKHCYFVENAREAAACIQQNLHKTHFEDKATLLKQDVLNAIRNIHEKEAELIYLDPPYESPVQQAAILALAQAPYVTENTLIIVEAALGTDFSYLAETDLEIVREKKYKANEHIFIRRRAADS